MWCKKSHVLYLFTILFYSNIIDILCYCEKEDEIYVIKNNGPNNLVLDGTDPSNMKAEYYHGRPQQLWKFKRASRAGLFYIINVHTGTALDLQTCDNNGCKLRLNGSENSSQNEWFITPDDEIVNAFRRENLNMWGGTFRRGDTIGTFKRSKSESLRRGNIYYTLALASKETPLDLDVRINSE